MQIDERILIRSKLAAYGFETGRAPIELNNNLLNIGRVLTKLPEKSNISNFKIDRKDVPKYTKAFFEQHFKLHEVPYMSISDASEIFKKYGDNPTNTSSLNLLVEELKNKSKYVSPYDIPVKYVNGHSMIGEIQKPIILVPVEEYLKELQIVFSEIQLGNNITKLTSATYAHEITHSQLESIKGSTRNYHNKEFVSIFIEKLVALELDNSRKILNKSELIRFRNLAEQIAVLYSADKFTRTQCLEATVAVTSTLKAENLFDKYLNGSDDLKSEILTDIQKIFDGQITVEDLLQKYEITLENSSNIELIKKHL